MATMLDPRTQLLALGLVDPTDRAHDASRIAQRVDGELRGRRVAFHDEDRVVS